MQTDGRSQFSKVVNYKGILQINYSNEDNCIMMNGQIGIIKSYIYFFKKKTKKRLTYHQWQKAVAILYPLKAQNIFGLLQICPSPQWSDLFPACSAKNIENINRCIIRLHQTKTKINTKTFKFITKVGISMI